MEQNRSVQYSNKNIFYNVYGKGKPVVLLHGFGEDGNIWKNISKELQKDFRLIIPDLPGSGKSELLDGNISIDDYAEVIKFLLDKELAQVFPTGELLPEPVEGLERAVIIGHSLGGYITLAFAEKYPELLNGIGLFHSSAFADDEEKKKVRFKGIEFIKNKGAYPFLKYSIPNLFADDKHQTDIELLIEEAKNFSPEALIQYYQAMINRPDRTDVLQTFKRPVLFIIGEKDLAVPLQISLQQCHLPAISHVHILKNSSHMAMIEEPGKCCGIIKNYLQNI